MTAAAVFRACPRVNGCPFVTTRHLRNLDLRPKARTIALALCASVAVHLGAMAGLGPRGEPVLIEGGGEAAPAALGTSFEDFAMGSSQPAPLTPMPPDVPPQTVTALDPSPLPPEQTAQPVPAAVAVAQATLPLQQQTAQPVMRAPMAEVAVLPDVVDPVAAAPELAVLTPPEMLPPDLKRSDRPETLQPDPAEPAVPVEQAHIPPSPKVSPRPPARPRDQTTPAPPAPRQTATSPAAPRGNAAQNAQRGSQQGTDGQAAYRAAARAQTAQAGNAAASSYPGEVMRRIQQVRQARSPARGRVLVAFGVAENGALASVSVARSSGHAGLDQVALDHIRRAAPFPAPPAGAQRQFSFEFVGR
ncbi:TonB family protein [Roseinatronobacter sp. NSM]|uniref:TonB family protein n=1 Tax=Roseinatronobacter sp. NSM TaxID=3457785 RepID=UPI004036607C